MKTRQLVQLFVLSAVWGVSFLMIRIAGGSFPPAWVGLLRCSAGAAFLWIILVSGRHALPPRRLFPWLFLVALTMSALPFSFFAWGERVVPSSTAAVINGTTPLWTLLLSWLVMRNRISGSTLVGVALGFTGVLAVVLSHSSSEQAAAGRQQAILGALIIALGAFGYAVATVVAKIKLKGLDPIGLATTQLSLAGLTLIPFALLGPHPGPIHLQSILAVLVLGLAGSGLAYLLYYNLLAHASATQVSAVTYLLPLWGLLWGAIANETITQVAFWGAATVVLGLVLINRPARPMRIAAEACPEQT